MRIIRKNRSLPVMKEEAEGEIEYLTFPSFADTNTVVHLFSTKRGGVSKGIYAEMNLSYTRGDEKEAVDENFARIAGVLRRKTSDFVCSQQTHTANVRVVTKEDAGKGVTKPLDYKDVDGLVTNIPGIVLATVYADCVPLFFLDPVKRVIGLAHSGWRGSADNIAGKTIQAMKSEYGCESKDILVAIGPSICRDCYEVSEDVAREFPKECVTLKENGKYLLDLWKANERHFREAGILQEHIETTDICTCCNSKELFSHRATKGKRGNMGAFLSLEPI